MAVDYKSAGCRSVGSAQKRVISGRAVDVDGDGKADLVRVGDENLIRSAAYPSLGAPQPWIVLPAASDQFGSASVRDLVMASEIGPDLGFLLDGQAGILPRVASLVAHGDDAPRRFVAGLAEPGSQPNAEVDWTLGDDHELESILVTYDDLSTSDGVASESYRIPGADVSIPALPSDSETVDAGALDAQAFLASTPEWSGACRDGDQGPDAARLACFKRTVGDMPAEEWMSQRRGRSWTTPEGCE